MHQLLGSKLEVVVLSLLIKTRLGYARYGKVSRSPNPSPFYPPRHPRHPSQQHLHPHSTPQTSTPPHNGAHPTHPTPTVGYRLHIPNLPRLLPPILHSPTQHPNPNRPIPQMVPPNPALLPASPHLQALPNYLHRLSPLQKHRPQEAAEFTRCESGAGVDE